MQKTIASIALLSVLGYSSAHAVLIAGWDFQTTTTSGTAVAVSPATPKVYVSNFGSGTLYLDGTQGSSDWFVPASGTTNTELNAFTGSSVNATNGLSSTTTSPAALALLGGATSGASFAANGKSMVFRFNMTGYEDLDISLSAQRTSTGFTTQTWEYSTDGTTYNSIGTLSAGTAAGTLASSFATSGVLTLPTVTGLNDVSTAYVRVTFEGATSASGNNRIDNVQLNATAVPEPAAAIMGSIGLLGLLRRRRI